VYEDIRLVHIQVFLSCYSDEFIGVSSRLVPTQYLTKLVLNQRDSCL
jgi:hypothetical protein